MVCSVESFLSKNANESMHDLLKSSHEYIMTRSKGMDIVSFVEFIEHMDETESMNLLRLLGVPHGTTPILNHSRKRLRSDEPTYVEVNDQLIIASQPKKAKLR